MTTLCSPPRGGLRWLLCLGVLAWAGGVSAAAVAPAVASTPASAQGRASEPVRAQAVAPPAEPDAAAAPVTVFNRVVVGLHAPLLGVHPRERARRAMAYVTQALDEGGPGEVTVKPSPVGHLILIDGVTTLTLSPDDVDPLNGDTLDALTERTAEALRLSIRETQEGRDTHHLLVSLAQVGAATLVALALHQGLAWLRRRVLQGAQSFVERMGAELGRGAAAHLIRRDRLQAGLKAVDLGLRWSLGLVMAYAWLSFVLLSFPYTRPWGEGLNQHLVGVILDLLKAVAGALPGLLVAALIWLLARLAVALLRTVFNRIEQGHLGVGWLEAGAVGHTRRLSTWLVWIFAVAMAYPYLPGSDTEAFKGMSVLIGLMLSLGASNFVGQVAGGLIITYTRTLRVGEYVRIGDHEGTVTAVGAFNTVIRTGLGEEITIPNSTIVGAATKNYSRAVKGVGYVVDTVVTIGYDTPWRQVEAMLIEAALRTQGVLSDPAPMVFQTALSDFYPEYRLVCQAIPAEPRPRALVLSQLHAHIQDVFNEHGVQIMSPHYVLDPAQEKLVPRERWYAPPARRPEGAAAPD